MLLGVVGIYAAVATRYTVEIALWQAMALLERDYDAATAVRHPSTQRLDRRPRR